MILFLKVFHDFMFLWFHILFTGIGSLNTILEVDLKVLDDLWTRKKEKGFRKKLQKKWRNTKELFKGLG